MVLKQVFDHLVQRLGHQGILAIFIQFLPKVCDFQILTEDVVLELILPNEVEVLHCSLLQLVEVVLKLHIDGFLKHEEEAFGKTDVVFIPFPRRLLPIHISMPHHALVPRHLE